MFGYFALHGGDCATGQIITPDYNLGEILRRCSLVFTQTADMWGEDHRGQRTIWQEGNIRVSRRGAAQTQPETSMHTEEASLLDFISTSIQSGEEKVFTIFQNNPNYDVWCVGLYAAMRRHSSRPGPRLPCRLYKLRISPGLYLVAA